MSYGFYNDEFSSFFVFFSSNCVCESVREIYITAKFIVGQSEYFADDWKGMVVKNGFIYYNLDKSKIVQYFFSCFNWIKYNCI